MAQGIESRDMLAVYGTLAPGESNHWVVSRIAGEWSQGIARGYVFEITWGPAEGYQGFIPDSGGSAVPVWVLQSTDLAKKWREIDDFEGAGYTRISTPVEMADQTVEAQIYVALTDVDD